MKRVASLFLPDWPIDRLRRAEPQLAPPPERARNHASLSPLEAAAAAEQAVQCDAPRNTGWRPGARWARDEIERHVATMPTHQRPPMREMGRRSEPAEHPFKRVAPGDEVGSAAARALTRWRELPPDPYPGDGPDPHKHARAGSNDPHAHVVPFFTTGRSSAGTIAGAMPDRSCSDTAIRKGIGDLPLVTVEKIGSRVLVAAASTSARALGVEPGTALTQARASVPDLVVRDADRGGDAADLVRMGTAFARRWTPVVAVSGEDGLFLDLTGVAHLHGGETTMARRIVRLLARWGISARIAIADTAGAAWAAARFTAAAPAIAAVSGHDQLAAFPVAALRLDDRSVELLHRLGIDTIGQLAALPRAQLVRRFGRAITTRLDQLTGAAPEPFDPLPVPEPIVVHQGFFEPIGTAEAIAHWLGQLVPRLSDALAQAGLGARAILLDAARIDRAHQVVRVGLARPTRSAAHLLSLLVRRIETIEPGYGIEALSLHVVRADPLAPETLGAHLAEAQAPDLAPLVDAIANRIGPARLWRMRTIESDVPERVLAPCPPLDPPSVAGERWKRDDVRRLDRRGPDHPWHPRWPRPARLLHRPERLDAVLAELPDQPPRRFTWRGRTHLVVRGDGPERIHGEWWRRTAEQDAVRDYFRVEDEAGQRFWLFRRGDAVDPATGDLSWYMHGAFG